MSIRIDAVDALYLSPHLDDAVLSCGGDIHRRTAAGQRVTILTVCAGAPPRGPLSPFAARLHHRWSTRAGPGPGEMVSRRRREDRQAAALLGARPRYLPVPDAIYRRAGGRALYDEEAAIFGRLDPAEGPLVAALARCLAVRYRVSGRTALFAPLAVGGHVDHRLVRAAAEAAWGGALCYYEDYPYASDDAAVGAAVDGRDGTWIPRRTHLTPADLKAKTAAIAAYASQIDTFWSDEDDMAAAVTAFAERRGAPGRPAERTWRRRAAPDR